MTEEGINHHRIKTVIATIDSFIQGNKKKQKDFDTVISVYAPYGCGKTRFSIGLIQELEKEKEFDYITIDMFKNDYQDSMITFFKVLENHYKDDKDKKKIIQLSFNIFLRKILINPIKLIPKIFSTIIIQYHGFIIKGELRELKGETKQQDPIGEISANLKTITKSKPLVFLVDEIDRCNPAFSVQMLERIKHFFDIPNVIFVLFISSNYISKMESQFTVYGIESNNYMSKFVNKTILLETDWHRDESVSIFTDLDEDSKEKFYTHSTTILNNIIVISNGFDLSIREIERIDKEARQIVEKLARKENSPVLKTDKYRISSSESFLFVAIFFLLALKIKYTNQFIELYRNKNTNFVKRKIIRMAKNYSKIKGRFDNTTTEEVPLLSGVAAIYNIVFNENINEEKELKIDESSFQKSIDTFKFLGEAPYKDTLIRSIYDI
ncbi:MAG: KAP family NTPase [Alphaproteobacteria bacterium]|jgi:hypothetical protein|nr:KAP family NTPase [Alphaproteobacteria bacterium]